MVTVMNRENRTELLPFRIVSVVQIVVVLVTAKKTTQKRNRINTQLLTGKDEKTVIPQNA